MSRSLLCVVTLALSASLYAASTITLVDEQFESTTFPPANWTAFVDRGPNDDTPLVFNAADGTGPNGAVTYGLGPAPYAGYPGMPAASMAAGYSSEINPWDGSSPQWIEKQLDLPVGTYDVTLELDTYLYYGEIGGDPWGCGDRVFLLTDNDTAQYIHDRAAWSRDLDADTAYGAGFRKTYWPGEPYDAGIDDFTWANDGVWQHLSKQQTITTTTGNFVFRLLMQEKEYGNAVTVLWDNIHLTFKQGGSTVASLDETFEAAGSLDSWTAYSGYSLNNNDTPYQFPSTQTFLPSDTGNGSGKWAGYSSNADPFDSSSEWLAWQKPAAVSPGTYNAHLEFNRYVYKEDMSDAYSVGNRVYILTDDLYANPTWPDWDADYSGGLPAGVALRQDFWPGAPFDVNTGDPTWGDNGVWRHEAVDATLTTTTGNIELRLLQHDKAPGAQAVAWDNVKLTITTPCNTPWADSNGDGFVDMLDFAILQTCLTTGNPTLGALSAECACFDRPTPPTNLKDSRITDQDIAEFVKCAAAPAIPWVQPTGCDATP